MSETETSRSCTQITAAICCQLIHEEDLDSVFWPMRECAGIEACSLCGSLRKRRSGKREALSSMRWHLGTLGTVAMGC